MKIYKGNIDITTSNQTEMEKLLSEYDGISGYLSINSKATLKADNLKSVGGYLYIYSQATLKADNLKSVGGDLYIYSQATLNNLKSVGGDLSIYSQATLNNLKSVGGYLSINSQATLKADNLKSVGSYLCINSKATLNNLKSVGGDLSINSKATLNNLKSVGGDLYINSQATLNNLKSVGGDLSIYSQATLNNLKSVGGYLSINSQISLKLQKQLWGHNKKNKYYVCEFISDWLLKRLATKSNTEYRISNVNFDYDLFCKVRKDKLTAEEVFAIENTEQRRVAYQKMDKLKMKELKNYKVEDEVKDDGYGFPMKVISFKMQNFKSPFYFLNCFCPSTNREYFIETRETDCWKSKQKSFGIDVKFDFEY
jgi:hypothetical protein